MASIIDPANKNYTFGLNFDYATWPEGSQVDLVNVPWNNDYRDIVKFDNQLALDNYIDSLNPIGIRLGKMTYLRPGEPISINIPHNVVNKYNYVRVSNPLMPVTPKDEVKNFYYFILECKLIAGNHTQLVVQLDVWSTYNFTVKFGNCFVERGHIGIANTNNFNNYGRDYLTTPEGLDTGSDYVITESIFSSFSVNRTVPGIPGSFPDTSVLATSSVDLVKDPGTVAAPKLNTAQGSYLTGISSGASLYAWRYPETFLSWLQNNADKPWVTQGILSIAIVPNLDKYFDDIPWPTGDSNLDAKPVNISGATFKSSMPRHDFLNNWRTSANIVNAIPSKYRKLNKLFTSPYMVMELTCYQATPVVLRPELWNNPNANVREIVSFVEPSQRLMAYPESYNTDAYSVTYRDVGEFIDIATVMSNFPHTIAVNNSGVSYIASNKNSIAFSYQNADWSQQRALAGAEAARTTGVRSNAAAYESGMATANTAFQNIAFQNQAIQAQANNNAMGSVASGIGGGVVGGAMMGPQGALVGGAAGAIRGGVDAAVTQANAGVQQTLNNQASGATAATAQQNMIRGNNAESANIDTNNAYAKYAASGDYQNAIAGINAKIQDTKMLQPTTSGQVGGDAFNIANDLFGVALKWKIIDKAHMAMIGDFWLRYGYAINRFIKFPSSFMVMTKFTYWKMSETYISSAPMPETFKQTIRGIFEKGVTVWKDPRDIGNVTLDQNDILPGISY